MVPSFSNWRFGSSYYPLHRDSTDWAGDLDLMAAGNFNAVRIGDFSWSRLEPAEGKYEFGWMNRFLDLAAERQISVLLISPFRCAPAWLMEQDPTIGIVNEAGVRLEFGSRYTFCINHPTLREKGLALAAHMAKHLGGHRSVIAWHLDNEYGDEPDCHCEHCKSRWHEWLRHRYTTIHDLNDAWGTIFWGLEFTRFRQIPTPRQTKTYHHPALLLAWRQFRSDCTSNVMKLHVGAIRQHSDKPITTNFQNLWNPRTDYFEAGKVLDFAGMNYYPPYGKPWFGPSLGMSVMRASAGGRFEIHELRNGAHAVPGRADNSPHPGEIECLATHCVAHGAEGIYYFQWNGVPFGPEQSHGTLTGYDGLPKAAYREAARAGDRIRAIQPYLIGSRIHSDIALLVDFRSRWASDSGSEWDGPSGLALDLCRSVFTGIRSAGLNCDALGREQDFSSHRILVVPILTCVDDTLANKFMSFVEDGGTLVWHPMSGIKNDDARIYPRRLHPTLERLFGVDITEFSTIAARETNCFQWQNEGFDATFFLDHVQPAAACEVIATFSKGAFSNLPAITRRQVGYGQAFYLSSFMETRFYGAFFRSLTEQMKTGLAESSQGVEMLTRTTADGRELLFLINNSNEAKTIRFRRAAEDVWNRESIAAGSIALSPWQVRVCIEEK